MKNKKRISKKIQNKKNKRNKRLLKSLNLTKIKPDKINHGFHRYNNRPPEICEKYLNRMNEQVQENGYQNVMVVMETPENGMSEGGWMKNEKGEVVVHPEWKEKVLNPNSNCLGYPWIDLGEIPEDIVEDIKKPSRSRISFDELKFINGLTRTTPNGREIYWGGGLKDEIFEQKSFQKKNPFVSVLCRGITNSNIFQQTEEVGFTDDILNDTEEMKKYMSWCVRLDLNINGVIDCPVDFYRDIFINDNYLQKVS